MKADFDFMNSYSFWQINKNIPFLGVGALSAMRSYLIDH